jgi:hypothetical protein
MDEIDTVRGSFSSIKGCSLLLRLARLSLLSAGVGVLLGLGSTSCGENLDERRRRSHGNGRERDNTASLLLFVRTKTMLSFRLASRQFPFFYTSDGRPS